MIFLKALVKLFASYGMACVLFLFLFIITLVGTFEQVERGLFYVQKDYFESMFAIHSIAGVPVPLPGVYLLLILLGINMFLGGILKIKKNPSKAGVLIVHIGIVVLLGGSLVQYMYSTDGHMMLYENDTASEYRDYYHWDISVTEPVDGDTYKEYVLRGEEFSYLPEGKSKTFYSDALPFEITVDRYLPNSQPIPKGPMFEADEKVIDGYFLQPQPLAKEAEQNIAGAYVTIKDKASGAITETILWGLAQMPFAITAGGKDYGINLEKRAYPLPFSIKLDEFIRELHPRTQMASNFESVVTKTENGVAQTHDIKMNEPLRHKGYTFYQASWGPSNAGPGTPLYSVLAVRRNPADKAPLYACIIITGGMVLHFSQRLIKHLRTENRRLA